MEQAWDREASDGLFPEPALPPERYAPSVECVRGSWVHGECGLGAGNAHWETSNSTQQKRVQEKLKHEREAGWGTSWRRVRGRAGKKIRPPPPHPSLQALLPCRCRGAAVPALAKIHWIVILRKPQPQSILYFFSWAGLGVNFKITTANERQLRGIKNDQWLNEPANTWTAGDSSL